MTSRSKRYQRTEQIIKAGRSGDPDAGPIEEMCFAGGMLEQNDLDHEAHLGTTAYLDYRYKSPYERTEEFMLAYQKWYAIKQRDGYGRVGRRVAKNNLAKWSDREITSFWRARQHADLLGVPYDRYIISVMSRAIAVGATNLPSPNQLYGDEVAVHVESDLAPMRAAGSIPLLSRDCDPRFFAENYTGDPVQVMALDAIEAEIRKAGLSNRARVLSRYMREFRLISEPESRRRLGDSLVNEALGERLLNSVRPDESVEQGARSVPGCFGYHRSTPHTMCSTCPVASACIERSAKIRGLLEERHGSADVRALRVREGSRKRKQRQRDRERAGKTMTLQEEKRILAELGNPKLKEKRLKAKERRDARIRTGSKDAQGFDVPQRAEQDPKPQG